MNKLITVLKALSDRNRLRVVAMLMQHQELCACQITELLQVTGATASRHMAILTASGVVTSRKEGRWVHYKLSQDAEYAVLFSWLATELASDNDVAIDTQALATILVQKVAPTP